MVEIVRLCGLTIKKTHSMLELQQTGHKDSHKHKL